MLQALETRFAGRMASLWHSAVGDQKKATLPRHLDKNLIHGPNPAFFAIMDMFSTIDWLDQTEADREIGGGKPNNLAEDVMLKSAESRLLTFESSRMRLRDFFQQSKVDGFVSPDGATSPFRVFVNALNAKNVIELIEGASKVVKSSQFTLLDQKGNYGFEKAVASDFDGVNIKQAYENTLELMLARVQENLSPEKKDKYVNIVLQAIGVKPSRKEDVLNIIKESEQLIFTTQEIQLSS